MVKLLHIYVDAKSFLAELTLKNVTITGIYTTYSFKRDKTNNLKEIRLLVPSSQSQSQSYLFKHIDTHFSISTPDQGTHEGYICSVTNASTFVTCASFCYFRSRLSFTSKTRLINR